MALSAIDRRLIERCLANDARSWEEFVDRFVGLVLHVVDHTATGQTRSLSTDDRDDLVADVFLALVADDFRILRQFRGESSLATYLTVVVRRIVLRSLAVIGTGNRSASHTTHDTARGVSPTNGAEKRIHDRDEVEQLMARLKGDEAEVVRMYHLEGKSYREISAKTGVPENSIGSTLSRARTKMRQANSDSAVGG